MTFPFPNSWFSTPGMSGKAEALVSWRGMTSIWLGALAAVTASSLFSVGLVLQAGEARTIPAGHALRLSLITQLVRHPRWVLGGVVILIGFGFHVAALSAAPLTVVQPALAAGLLVLMAVGLRSEHERAGVRELAGLAGIIVGLVALTFTTPSRATGDDDPQSIAIALAALGAAVLIPQAIAIASARVTREGSLLATFGAGAAYAMTGLTTKLFSDNLTAGDWAAALFWLALTAVVAVVAVVDQTTALQRRSVVEVGPIVYVLPVVIPVLLAPALVGEGWGNAPHGVGPLLLSLVVVCVAAGVLAGSSTVASGGSPAGSG
jgi:drug/metabolite transporter (DMT)-like permease